MTYTFRIVKTQEEAQSVYDFRYSIMKGHFQYLLDYNSEHPAKDEADDNAYLFLTLML